MTNRAAVLAVLFAVSACAPKLAPPGEATRITGRVKAKAKRPFQIHVYERCSPRFYFFERCPGRLIGEAKIARPGPFVVETDPESPELSVFAFRGDPGAEEECAAADVAVAELKKPLRLKVAAGPCPVKLPAR